MKARNQAMERNQRADGQVAVHYAQGADAEHEALFTAGGNGGTRRRRDAARVSCSWR